ncbi:growth-regulating factor 6-like [Tasmannia lanceolata]|uniref:growth-regulating factor 6-like n=1 Tax=Tasmannia lanceolata TaxID=3420 RepID=UPI00406400B0
MMNGRNRLPHFTASQWEELGHQDLIFKYRMCEMTVPPELMYKIRSRWEPTTPRLFPHQPFPCPSFQMGFGRKEDLEPGRCRRTDGKKWRCAKEALPCYKYCEKHMYRGQNRSRKAVENTSDPPPISPPTPLNSSNSSDFVVGFSSQNKRTHSDDEDYRYLHGVKEGVDEHAFFSKASGTLRNISDSSLVDSLSFMPMGMNSLAEKKHENCPAVPSNYSQQKRHCFVMGTDFNMERPVKMEIEEEPQQPIHHFFDECTPNREPWMHLEEDPSNEASFSRTQLSISTPMALLDSSAFNYQTGNLKDD